MLPTPPDSSAGSSPLAGLRVLEVGGIGPGPFTGMLLADMGADVVRVDRPGAPRVLPGPPTSDLLNRGKRSIALDLKDDGDRDTLLALADRAAVLIEGFRPGVAERLGFGPEVCHRSNPALVYGRMTGWGQDGPYAARAGHDINYIGVTGALHAIGGAAAPPSVPLNLVGDFGGGALYLAVGVLAALHDTRRTGIGTVIDAAIVDGTTHMLASIHGLMNVGAWTDARESNLLDGAAPFYRTYETADGRYMAVGAIEPQFYAALLTVLDVGATPEAQNDSSRWPVTRARFAERFAERTQAQWTEAFAGHDACVTPVLTLEEASRDPHLAARATLVETAGRRQPGRAPRFVSSNGSLPGDPPAVGQDTTVVLRDWLGHTVRSE